MTGKERGKWRCQSGEDIGSLFCSWFATTSSSQNFPPPPKAPSSLVDRVQCFQPCSGKSSAPGQAKGTSKKKEQVMETSSIKPSIMVLVNSLQDYLLDYPPLPVLFPSPRSWALLNLAAGLLWQKVPAGTEGQQEPGSRVLVSLAEGFSLFSAKFILNFLRALEEEEVASLETHLKATSYLCLIPSL